MMNPKTAKEILLWGVLCVCTLCLGACNKHQNEKPAETFEKVRQEDRGCCPKPSDKPAYSWRVDCGKSPSGGEVIRVRATFGDGRGAAWDYAVPLGQEHLLDIEKVDLGRPLGEAVCVKLGYGAGSLKTVLVHATAEQSQIRTIFSGVSKRGIRLEDVDFDEQKEVILIVGDLYGPVSQSVYRYDDEASVYKQRPPKTQSRPQAGVPEINYTWRMEDSKEQSNGPGRVIRIEAASPGRQPLQWAYSISEHEQFRVVFDRIAEGDIRLSDIDSDGLQEIIAPKGDGNGSAVEAVYHYDPTKRVYVQAK